MSPKNEVDGQQSNDVTNMPAPKFLSVPQSLSTDYSASLREYFSTYNSNRNTFFYVNLVTINMLRRGTYANPAVFGFNDIMAAFDRFFIGDGSLSLQTFNSFMARSGIDEDNRYAHLAASNRLQIDILDLKLARSEPRGKKPVIPSAELIQSSLCKQIKALGRTEVIEASRFLPAYFREIEDYRTAGLTQKEIAKLLSRTSVRPVSQTDISRFLNKIESVREGFEKKKRRAIMTLSTAQHYVDENMQRGGRSHFQK